MTHSTKRVVQALALGTLLNSAAFCQKQLVHLPFNEGSGTTTANLGTLGGTGTFEQQAGFPVFSKNAPSGPFSPSNNTSSIDFGTIDAPDDGGRAIDFPEATANPTVGMSAFTLTGWLNLRQDNIGCGGNRILTTWNGNFNDGGGLELVHESDGLRFSVNEAPDFPGPGPYSSPDSLTVDSDAGVSNWVFFAVSYDAGDLADDVDGIVTYYLGSASELATEDTVTEYDKGAIGLHSNQSEPILTIGNFNPNVGGPRYESGPRAGACASRVLRGLVDDLQMYEGTLTLEQVRAAQMPTAGTRGDFNGNGTLDAADIDALSAEVTKGTNTATFDVTGDGTVDEADRTEWVTQVRKTWFGDANLNGEFNSSDFVAVFGAGKYETDQAAGWAEGDWSGDAKFNSTDFVTAFTDGGYEKGHRVAIAAVPEPMSLHLILLGVLAKLLRRRRA